MRARILALVLGCSALSLAACGDKSGGGPKPPAPAPGTTPQAAAPAGTAITDAARAEAKEIFATRCTPCHGPEGMGNGPASAGLTPPPRNLQDPAWQASVTDEHIEKIIQYGGAAVGKSPAMPPNPDLLAKPVTVAALREHVRKLKK